MKKQGKKINGALSSDAPQVEEMRQIVVEQELSARSHKAYYEKMYYALESEKLEPLYKEYAERKQKQREEEKEAFEKFKATLAEELQKQNEGGNINLEETN